MGNGRRILTNTLMLTLSSLAMRSIGMIFQVYLTNRINAAGVGLFGLIMSVYALFTTLAISGIRFAATRLISEELAISPEGKIDKTVRTCLMYGLFFGSLATVLMLIFAKPIGLMWIKDHRSILSLRVISISLPPLAMSAALSGYFTAVGRVYKSSVSQFIEQLTRIITVAIIYSVFGSDDIEISCAVIMLGGALGDFVSFTLQYTMYIFDRRRFNKPRKTQKGLERTFRIAFPLALSAYCRTALSTLQQLLVPVGFQKAGYSSEKALADYGIIQGMVLPVITFPSALFYSFSEIIVPILTEAQMNKNQIKINSIVNRTLHMTLIIAFGIAGILFRYSYELGNLFYGINDVGKYIRVLSLLMPIMYLDSITDGLLRGLGEHMYNMWVNISDSVISVIFVYTLLPKWAIDAYLFIICFTEVFNFSLSIHKLSKISEIKLDMLSLSVSLFSSLAAVSISMLLLRTIGVPLVPTALSVTFHIVLTLIVYFIFIKLFNCINIADYKLIKSIFTKKEF